MLWKEQRSGKSAARKKVCRLKFSTYSKDAAAACVYIKFSLDQIRCFSPGWIFFFLSPISPHRMARKPTEWEENRMNGCGERVEILQFFFSHLFIAFRRGEMEDWILPFHAIPHISPPSLTHSSQPKWAHTESRWITTAFSWTAAVGRGDICVFFCWEMSKKLKLKWEEIVFLEKLTLLSSFDRRVNIEVRSVAVACKYTHTHTTTECNHFYCGNSINFRLY